MKVSVEFDSMEEFEAFRTSGKKTRAKGQVDEPSEAQVASQPSQPQMQVQPPQQFTPPPAQPAHGFPGANGPTPPPAAAHPLVGKIIERIDSSLASGQTPEAIVAWFGQQIGPEAANATIDQLKQILLPRMSEAQLRGIAPQLGITA